MIKQGTTTIILFTSFIAVAASQIILKARFEVLGLTSERTVRWSDAFWRLLADPMIWVGAVLVVTGTAGWYFAMTKLPISFMLPATALIMPMVTIGAYFFLGEGLGWSKIMATLVIVTGVIWLGFQSA